MVEIKLPEGKRKIGRPRTKVILSPEEEEKLKIEQEKYLEEKKTNPDAVRPDDKRKEERRAKSKMTLTKRRPYKEKFKKPWMVTPVEYRAAVKKEKEKEEKRKARDAKRAKEKRKKVSADMRMVDMETGLSEGQIIFCEFYVATMDRKYAAKKANFSMPYVYALLRDPDVISEVNRLKQEKLNDLATELAVADVNQKRLLEELRHIAYARIDDYYDEKGNLKPFSELPESAIRAISGLEYDKNGNPKLLIYDKKSAIKLLMQYLNMLNINVKIDEKKEITYKIQMEEIKSKYSNLGVEELEQLHRLLSKANQAALPSPQEQEVIDIPKEDVKVLSNTERKDV